MRLVALLLLAAMSTFAAPAECRSCHREAVDKHASTTMFRALESAALSEILKSNPKLVFQLGPYAYKIDRQGDRSVYSVSDGKETISAPIAYAFGLGAAGQTYVFERDGDWYESRVSFYSKIQGLDLTMGAPPGAPKNIREASGRLMSPRDQTSCFGCHALNATKIDEAKNERLHLDGMTPGVQCDNCHGPSQTHVASFPSKPVGMPKLARKSTEEQSELCGQCHRTWADIAANGPRGVGNVRFQPYRMALSKCYDTEDRRIACTACHDPHAQRAKDAAAYDKACAACHRKGSGTRAAARLCKVQTRDCASCHMPRYEIPGSHHQFTDHYIRIAKPNEPYPN